MLSLSTIFKRGIPILQKRNITFIVKKDIKENPITDTNEIDLAGFLKQSVKVGGNVISLKEFRKINLTENKNIEAQPITNEHFQYIENYKKQYIEHYKKKIQSNKGEIQIGKILKSSDLNGLKSGYLNTINNSFIYTCWLAYNRHYHLEIRPDNIWLAIMVQFSFYVNKNSGALRDKFVGFKDTKEILVEMDYPIFKAPFDKVVLEFSNQIGKLIKDESIRDWVVPNFTTTTPTDKVVFSAVLMSTMQKYFKFTYNSLCGLPKVTLNGTTDDWINLKSRVLNLKQFNIDDGGEINSWIDLLVPVINNFIESSKGNPDIDWWNKMVRFQGDSDGNWLSGWLTVFCMFDNEGNFWKSYDKSSQKWPIINESVIANGFTYVPIKLKDFDHTVYHTNLYSGHFAFKVQDKDNKLLEEQSVTPSIDWFLVEQ